MTYYKLLNINIDASPKDIKTAYKNMAKRWHPDKNNNSRESEKMFKDLSEAYEMLSDPAKKQQYDNTINGSYKSRTHSFFFTNSSDGINPRTFKFNSSNNRMGHQFFDPFNNSKDHASKDHVNRPENPLRNGQKTTIKVKCTLEEMSQCSTKQIKLIRKRLNQGKLVSENKTFDIKLPPGCTTGTTIIYKREGNQHLNRDIQASDIVFIIEEKPHLLFKRNGVNLVYNINIKLIDVLLGGKLTITDTEGKILNILVNSKHVKDGIVKSVIKNKGMTINTTRRGDLWVIGEIIYPDLTELKGEDIKMLQKLLQ